MYKFKVDKINLFSVNLDISSSMENHCKKMREGLGRFGASFDGFSESKSIAIAKNTFNDVYYDAPFRMVSEFDDSYSSYGNTAMYDAIIIGGSNLIEYMKEVTARNNCLPRGTYLIWTDGESNSGMYRGDNGKEKAERKVKEMNEFGITTVFVAFGHAIKSSAGKALGFQSVIDVKDVNALAEFIGETLPRSFKLQSKSVKSLGSEFFSKAASTKSKGYSQRADQILNNEDYFPNI